jgi:hypothetical protein
MIEVYDDIVPVEVQEQIELILSGPDFFWFLFPGENNGSVGDAGTVLDTILVGDPRVREYLTLGHNFLKNGRLTSDTAQLVYDMFQQFCQTVGIEQTRIGRIKANFQTQCNFSHEEFFNTPHIDRTDPHTVAIYYVNDSDGDTYIFDTDGSIIKSIAPKRGRFLVFDGSLFHAGRHPIDANKRILINFNF